MRSTESVHVSKCKKKNVVIKLSEKEPEEGSEEEIDDEVKEVSEDELDEDPEDDQDEEEVSEEELDEDPEEDPAEELYEESDEDATSSSIDSKEPESDCKEELNDETKSSLKSVTSSVLCVNNDVAKPIEDQNLFSSEANVSNPYSVSNAPETQDPGGSSGRKWRSRWCPVQEKQTDQSDGTSKKRKTRWDDSPLLGTFKLPDFMYSLEHEMDPKTISLKMQLMEINSKLQSSEIHDNRPAEERSPSPEPEYNNLGMRINTREARLRKKLRAQQKHIISKLAKTGLNFRAPAKLVEKIYVPVKENPDYNFIGLIIGPRGNTQKEMEKKTGAKIRLRGKGSMNKKPDPPDDEDLHVLVEADNQQSLDAAVEMVKKLLVPVADEMNNHKRAQLQELAKLRGIAVPELRGTCEDKNICNLCKEQGHQQYACPRRESTFKAMVCDICGSFSHLSSECSLSMASQMCLPLQGSYGVGIGSNGKSSKQMDDADLYVGYLPQTVDDNRLKELFSPFGKIVQTRVIKDRTTGLSKGYGFVKFENPVDANAAVLHMNGYKMEGKMLAVRVAGQKPVLGPSHLGNHPIHSVPPAVRPNISGQTSCFFGPSVFMLPEAQASILKNQSSYFPSSLVHFGHYNNFPITEFSSIPPRSESNIADSRMAGTFFSTSEFHSQIMSSNLPSNSFSRFPALTFSSTPEFPSKIMSSNLAPNSLSQFPGASVSNNPSLYFSSSSVHFGHFNNLRRPEILSIAPSSETNTPDTRMAGTFSSTSEFPSQITNSSSDPNSLSWFPGDPDYRGSQFKSYFSL
ncbi:splicing factor-like protein 1 [Olea europaea var. sylvestris]|uniref:splicing factor-like protein 1 n=1 Tax=Olea europaea var. sylvestris TaxID=158386 RepID=UPI000C1CCD24|nr:splicing factor-like protein 1 [Olea europaea var. sylvestris]